MSSSGRAYRLLAAGLVSLSALMGACGGDSDAARDSSSADAWVRSCWAGGGTPTPDAEVIMGQGPFIFDTFDEGDPVLMQLGPQGGAHLQLSARMRGFEPGLFGDVTVPAPHTFFTAYDESGERITTIPCAYPRPLADISDIMGEGWYELEYGSLVNLADSVFRDLPGQRVRVLVEVQDSLGHYATAEHWGVVENISEPIPPTPMPDAGVPDAGLSDAGVPDAAALR